MKEYVRFTVEVHDEEYPENERRLVWEKPSIEITLDDMCECIRTLMCGLTFSNEAINDMFIDYVLENRLIDKKEESKIENKSREKIEINKNYVTDIAE